MKKISLIICAIILMAAFGGVASAAPGDPCGFEMIEDCNGNCFPATYEGDEFCDDGNNFPYADFMCSELNYDGGDCGGGGGCPAGQIEDCNGNCYDASWVGDGYCDDGTWGAVFNCDPFCGEGELADCGGVCGGGNGCPAGQIEDCDGNCYDASWVGDGYCDDGTYGAYFNCDPFCGQGELADCGPELCGGPPPECPAGQIKDCNGNCYDASWVGDGYCDDGTYGAYFNCDPFCGQGELADCGPELCGGPPPECPAGQIKDCNGNCYDASWVGDGYCDDGTYGAYFNCDPFCGQGELADCGGVCGDPCPAGQIQDCDGNCYNESWATDSFCDDDKDDTTPGKANFMCPQFDNDAGACIGRPCDEDKIWDCIGDCALESWLGDGVCDDDASDSNPNLAALNCIAADNGDCLPGAWVLSYDWGCDGSPASVVQTFYADGTFTDAAGGGTWTLSGDQITVTYNDGPAIYTGTVSANHMEGTMVIPGSLNGCWTADKGGGAKEAAVSGPSDTSRDASGNTL